MTTVTGPKHSRSQCKPVTTSAPPYAPDDHRDFFDGEDTDTAGRAAARLLSDPKHPSAPFDSASTAASMAASSASELSERSDTPLENLHTLIPTLIAQGRLVAGNTAAKLESMTAVFTGRHTPYDSVLFTSGQAASNSVLSTIAEWHSAPAAPVRIARDEPLVFHVDLESNRDEAVVTIRCNSAVRDFCRLGDLSVPGADQNRSEVVRRSPLCTILIYRTSRSSRESVLLSSLVRRGRATECIGSSVPGARSDRTIDNQTCAFDGTNSSMRSPTPSSASIAATERAAPRPSP